MYGNKLAYLLVYFTNLSFKGFLMSYTAEQLLSLSNSFEEFTSDSLVKSAKKKDEKKKFPFWLKNKGKKDSNSAKDKSSKKLDPKAEVRNRGDVCVPAEKAKDKKDHFPINSESQARNALAQVNKFTNAPEWYNGSLQSLVSLVAKKVKAKYPSIEVSKDAKTPGKKKASAYYNGLLKKFGQDPKPPAGTPGSPEYAARKENGGPGDPNDSVMELGDGNVDEEGNQLRQPRPQPTKNYGNAAEQELVKKIQEYLNNNKFNAGIADGKLGTNTAGALKRWQKSVKLPETGQLDKATWDKLSEFIPELGSVGTNKLPVDLGYVRGVVENARAWIEKLNAAHKAGQLKDMATAKQYWASLAPFSDPNNPASIPSLIKQLNGMAAIPNLEAEQKKQINDLLFNANDATMALAQWNQILSGQFAQTGQMPGVAPAQPTAPAALTQPAAAAPAAPKAAHLRLEDEFFRKLGSKYIY